MDTATAIDTLAKGVGGGIVAPNEARQRLDLPPVQGGDTPYLQQQNYSLEALDERDRNAPFAKPTPAAPPRELAGQASHEESPGGADVASDQMRRIADGVLLGLAT
jgi:phage portal protein BeeE